MYLLIIKYIRRGLNHVGLQNAIAGLDFAMLNDMHAAIIRYLGNSIRRSDRPVFSRTHQPVFVESNVKATTEQIPFVHWGGINQKKLWFTKINNNSGTFTFQQSIRNNASHVL